MSNPFPTPSGSTEPESAAPGPTGRNSSEETVPIPADPAAVVPDPSATGDQTPVPDPSAPRAAASVPVRRHPLFATIFWGVVLLAFAVYMVIWTVFPAALDPALWLLGGVIAIGLMLVVAGIAAAARRAG